jgi:hypothetical protein
VGSFEADTDDLHTGTGKSFLNQCLNLILLSNSDFFPRNSFFTYVAKIYGSEVESIKRLI